MSVTNPEHDLIWVLFYQFSERENPRFQSWDDSSAGMRVRFGELESHVIYSNIF